MGGRTLRFDPNEANTLRGTIGCRREEIGTILCNSQDVVEGCREWWKGGSEQAFIDRYSQAREEITTVIERFCDDYNETMRRCSEIIQRNDENLASQWRR